MIMEKIRFICCQRSSLLLISFFLFFFPVPARAHHILFYYNSLDGTDGSILQCVAILQAAGHTVTTVDVKGKNRDPTNDNWGYPYDQVWDMRFVDRDQKKCGSGSSLAADYFDGHWRAKAIVYLSHCGKFFVAGEHYQLADRDEGLYKFLKDIGAVKEGYDACPPSARGNSSTNGEAFYPVRNGLGPVIFFGAYVGGIPTAFLNGTSFVETRKDWQGGDKVNRSIASGWVGDQLGGQVSAPLCVRGRFFMVWDATMWALWNIQVKTPEGIRETKMGQEATLNFFPAVAQWLGGMDCPCATLVPIVSTPTSLKLLTTTRTQIKDSQLISAKPETSSSAPETIVFTDPPVNVYMRFRDGVGDYRLDVSDRHGNFLKTLYEKAVTTEKDSWASWDGVNQEGKKMSVGTYFAVFSKDGKTLRRIVLSWIQAGQ
ncbi:MAG TPA: hypothetical protein VIJ93_09115 [bacterium]